ncbi:hypothetical protein F4818DRAFT_12182 [Hypoxylon cercidicola]|nr:hypothetical protein F4818DRAFT_12182 [Hypoxylon cercidicola]
MYKLFAGQGSELEVLYEPPQASELKHDVYVVHGFYTAKYSNYKAVFEDWIIKSVKAVEVPLRIKVFRFDINLIATCRQNHALLQLAWALRQSLLGISDDGAASGLLDSEAFESQNDSEITRRNVMLPKRVSFITHGFGAWIVREALASPGNRNPAYVPIHLIFIDAPMTSSDVESSSRDYSTYFKQIQGVFRISPTDIQSEDHLKSHLLKIDRNFEAFLTHSSSHGCVENLPVWINTEAGDTSTWTDRILRFVPLYPLPSHSTPLKELHLTGLFNTWASYEGNVSSGISPSSLPRLTWDDSQQNLVRKQSHGILPPDDRQNYETMSDASNVTVPTLDSDLKRDLNTMGQLACSFLQRGELEDAETLYVRIHDTLLEQSNYSPLKLLQIRLQIAYIRLYLGRYEETKNDLAIIQQHVKDSRPNTDSFKRLKTELDFDCRRCLAGHMLRTGEWGNAAVEFERLLTWQEGNTQDKSPSFKIIRDLALACAYLGEYQKGRDYIAEARSRLKSQEDPSTSKDYKKGLLIKHSGLDVVESTIDMLSGNYTRALSIASKSLTSLEVTLSPRHFKTLAVANLKTWCLVHEGRFSDGTSTSEEYHKSLVDIESLCLSTFSKLAQGMGRRHFLALDSMECLVRIFICQGRLAEAIDTGTSVYENVTQSLSQRHPQAISCKCQLAAAHLAQGNYRTSQSLYKDVYREATETLGPNHPKTVRYSCELARACLYHGEIENACAIAIKGAAQQVGQNYGNQSSNSTTTTQILISRLGENMSGSRRLHPDLIYSLQLLAEIELRKHRIRGLEGNLDIAEQILRFLVESLTSADGSTSVLKTTVYYDLAIILRERYATGSHVYFEFIEILEQVVQDRKRLLGEDHPDTLQGCRELLRSNLVRTYREEKNLENSDGSRGFLSTSKNIWTSLESRYGSQFPQTLHSRLWYFYSSSVFGYFQGQEMEEEVLAIGRILSNPQLVSERLIESISMRNHLAEFLIQLRIPSSVQRLLDSTQQDLEKALEEDKNESLRGALERLRGVVEELKLSNEKMPSNEDMAFLGEDDSQRGT